MLNTVLIILFVLAYTLIAFEHSIRVNKAAVALVAGVLSWILLSIYAPAPELIEASLGHHVTEIAGILFFLMGAMTIVEIIDAHEGFDLITRKLSGLKANQLIWIIALFSFFLSAVLDNLTTTILMISLLGKILPAGRLRMLYAGFVVIAANAGGAWSPIGDVTTTMLWIGGQISSGMTIKSLFLPSLVNVLLPLIVLSFIIRREGLLNNLGSAEMSTKKASGESKLILFMGLTILVMVPLFKILFHLPPYMGMLFGLGIMWCFTEVLNGRRDEPDKKNFSAAYALQRIDTPSILFFMGILLSISSLAFSGVLGSLSQLLDEHIPNQNNMLLFTGFLSAVIDNVPLVAAYQGMYELQRFASDSDFWQLLAYCSGTGGSMLIIGSAAGVVAMGVENISFGWYLRNFSWLAALGYLGGYFCFLLIQ